MGRGRWYFFGQAQNQLMLEISTEFGSCSLYSEQCNLRWLWFTFFQLLSPEDCLYAVGQVRYNFCIITRTAYWKLAAVRCVRVINCAKYFLCVGCQRTTSISLVGRYAVLGTACGNNGSQLCYLVWWELISVSNGKTKNGKGKVWHDYTGVTWQIQSRLWQGQCCTVPG